MNILLFTLEYPPFKGGVANYYEKLVSFWPSKNIFVLNNNNNKLINNKFPFLKWLPSLFYLYKNIKTNKIDHVIVGNLLPLGTATLIICKFLKIKYTVIIHGTDISYANKNNRKNYLSKKILNSAKNIIVNSEYVASLAREKINKKSYEKISVVNPGIKIIDYETDNGLRQALIKEYDLENKIILFSIGRLIKRKGVDYVIEVLSNLFTSYPNIIYLIGGVGKDEDALKTLAINFKKNIIFLGRITEKEKWAWMDLMDIFVQPAREEDGNFDGFGIVYLEAGLFSKPVIAGNSGGVSDAVENNVNGLLIDPNNKKEIKDAILKLVENKNLRLKLGEQARNRLKKFQSKDKVNDIYKIINQI